MSTIGMSANIIFYIYVLECANNKWQKIIILLKKTKATIMNKTNILKYSQDLS